MKARSRSQCGATWRSWKNVRTYLRPTVIGSSSRSGKSEPERRYLETKMSMSFGRLVYWPARGVAILADAMLIGRMCVKYWKMKSCGVKPNQSMPSPNNSSITPRHSLRKWICLLFKPSARALAMSSGWLTNIDWLSMPVMKSPTASRDAADSSIPAFAMRSSNGCAWLAAIDLPTNNGCICSVQIGSPVLSSTLVAHAGLPTKNRPSRSSLFRDKYAIVFLFSKRCMSEGKSRAVVRPGPPPTGRPSVIQLVCGVVEGAPPSRRLLLTAAMTASSVS